MPIDFNDLWGRHGDDPSGVFTELASLLPHAENTTNLLQLAGLVTHLAGGHLGQWSDGLAELATIMQSPHFDPDIPLGRAVYRCAAVLHLGAGDAAAAEDSLARAHNPGSPPDQARLRMLATLAEAWVDLGDTDAGAKALDEALDLAAYGPDREDPASRNLAASANNIACCLETMTNRTAKQTELMKHAATTARTWWEVAGAWTHVKIAEYRLAMTFLQAGEPLQALEHGRQALALVDENEGTDVDRFYPWLAVGQAQLALGDADAAREAANRAAEGVPDWGRAELEAFQKAVGS